MVSSAGVGKGPALRSLIVDDDPAVRELLEDLLLQHGIDAQLAEDGREGEHWLRATSFDLLFLDFNMPYLNGDALLELIRQGAVQRPGAVILMSSDEAIQSAPAEHWLRKGVLGFMAKPFQKDQVTAFVELARTRREAVEDPPVLIAGAGLWADALTRVVYRGGGRMVEAHGPTEVPDVIRRDNVPVAVFGPPIPSHEMLLAVGTCRTLPELAKTALYVTLSNKDPSLAEDLAALGATGIYVMPDGLARLSTDVIASAGLNTRSHRRAPLAAAVKIKSNTVTIDAYARDVSEGGMGLVRVKTRPPMDDIRVEFPLPGETTLVRAGSQLAWTRSDGDNWQIGIRFTALDEADRTRIRRYVEARAVVLRHTP